MLGTLGIFYCIKIVIISPKNFPGDTPNSYKIIAVISGIFTLFKMCEKDRFFENFTRDCTITFALFYSPFSSKVWKFNFVYLLLFF